MIITRELQVDAGHRIAHHGGMCKGLHGHRYRVLCSVAADQLGEGVEEDMVMDFSRLKAAMVAAIHDPCDHALMLIGSDPLVAVLAGDEAAQKGALLCLSGTEGDHVAVKCADGTRLYLMANAPTAERLAEHWGLRVEERVEAMSKGTAGVVEVQVWETPNCCATWYAFNTEAPAAADLEPEA